MSETCENWSVLSTVAFTMPWNLHGTAFLGGFESSQGFIWNKGSVNIWNYHKAQRQLVQWTFKDFFLVLDTTFTISLKKNIKQILNSQKSPQSCPWSWGVNWNSLKIRMYIDCKNFGALSAKFEDLTNHFNSGGPKMFKSHDWPLCIFSEVWCWCWKYYLQNVDHFLQASMYQFQ